MRAVPPFALLLALPLAACERAPADPRGIDRDETLLQVSASGRAETRPDEARFTAGVSSIGANAGAATRANNEAMNRVIAALGARGIGKDDIQARSLSVARIDYGPNRGRYEANNLAEVRVRKIDDAGTAIAAATEAGANILSGPDLRVSDREAANRSAYAAAYKAARARAEVYAGAAGLKIARVLAIRDGGEGAPPMPYIGDTRMAAPQAVNAAPPISPGITTSEVRVSVDFALEE